ncbi:hypothetical protein OF83DRAFT_1291694 [Amylostereum chailletii]|nr:hypothetical protein OF83DRAFT_1291694 [Amylostereum chailletii]
MLHLLLHVAFLWRIWTLPKPCFYRSPEVVLCQFSQLSAFPVLAVEPNIVQDSVEVDFGTPSPTLSVVCLFFKELQPYVFKTNKHLTSNSQLAISLHDGIKAFVALTSSGVKLTNIFTQPLNWTKSTDLPESATHAIDFGPGGLNSIGPMTARSLDRRVIRVIVLSEKGKGDTELFSAGDVKYDQSWTKKGSPKLMKTSDDKVHVDNPFTRLLGKSPIIVAGMTPTTVKAGLVSAVLSAGYHVELDGGGHHSRVSVCSVRKVAKIQTKIPDGFTFRYPLWQDMKKEGLPIEGFCVAAGIPTTEGAVEIIDGLKAAGIRHISFKPGSIAGIRPAVNIASANPDFPIIMQWTGGRAGTTLTKTSTSQFSRHTPASANMTTSSSLEFGVQPMPYGFLFASRVMIAKEAHTSSSVKDLIVKAAGVEDAQWEGTCSKETGGILTVCSEFREPIYKVATRALKLWKEFDDTVFKLPREKRGPWLKDNAGSTQIFLRNLTGDWLRRIEERFAGVKGLGKKASILQWLDTPGVFVQGFLKAYPLTAQTLFGLPKISRPFSTKCLNVFIYSRVLSRPIMPSNRTNRSKRSSKMLHHSQLVAKLLGRSHSRYESKIPVVDYVESPETEDWLELLAGAELNWYRTPICSPTVAQGKSFIDDPLHRLFAPHINQKVAFHTASGISDRVALYDNACSYGEHKAVFKAIEVKYNASMHVIEVTLFENRHTSSVSLPLQFICKPSES